MFNKGKVPYEYGKILFFIERIDAWIKIKETNIAFHTKAIADLENQKFEYEQMKFWAESIQKHFSIK